MSMYDIADLKDQIRKLKVVKTQLENEKVELLEATAKGETKLSALKQEYNLIAPTDEIRFTADETEDSSISLIDNAKFKKLNNKLEMQLLSVEIRNSLPRLEAEVLKWESQVKGTSKMANRSEKLEAKYPPLLLKSAAEIEEIIGSKFDERFRLKNSISDDLDRLRVVKTQLSNDIASHRRHFNQLCDEKELLMLSNQLIDNSLYQEQVRLEILKKHHIETREALSACHNGNGWKTEAFLSVTDKISDSVPVTKLPKLLTQWIVCSDQPNTINLTYIKQLLSDVHSGSPSKTKVIKPSAESKKEDLYNLSDDEDELKVISSASNKPARSNTKSPSPSASNNNVDAVDFTTFCKLCDQIIILHEF